jgi:hypothetical protein
MVAGQVGTGAASWHGRGQLAPVKLVTIGIGMHASGAEKAPYLCACDFEPPSSLDRPLEYHMHRISGSVICMHPFEGNRGTRSIDGWTGSSNRLVIHFLLPEQLPA